MNLDNDLKQPLIHLQLTTEQLDTFCKKVVSRSRNSANSHEALTVLEAFFSNFSSDSAGSDIYNESLHCLKSHSANTRAALMKEKTQQLQKALVEKNICMLAEVYSSLSRNGFYQILQTACSQLEAGKLQQLALWAIAWSETAQQQAEQASGYPDALDFKKANIDIEEYQTMSDISHFFKNT